METLEIRETGLVRRASGWVPGQLGLDVGGTDEAESIRATGRRLDLGIHAIDTEPVGSAGPRSSSAKPSPRVAPRSCLIATKAGLEWRDGLSVPQRIGPRQIESGGLAPAAADGSHRRISRPWPDP